MLTLLVVVSSGMLTAQNSDIALLTAKLLGETPIEEDLQELCDEIGGRVTGSVANERSVAWGLQKFTDAGVRTWEQTFEMPALWLERSTTAEVTSDIVFTPLVTSKFLCPPGTYSAPLLDAGRGTQEDFTRLGASARDAFVLVETDICFDINGLFAEYLHASGVEDFARAAGVTGIVFMASRPNRLLYRFVTKRVLDNEMPQIVMAREDAQRCQRLLRNGESLMLKVVVDARVGDSYESTNIIAEIPGSTHPEQVVIIGAHLDSWALGTGANDNGCNVSMLIDIARQMQKLGIKPQRTIRFALWNGEEQGFFGSHAYTQQHAGELNNHVLAISIDIGSGAIIGFFANGRKELIPLLDKLLEPVQALGPFMHVDAGIVGTDNFDFMLEGVPNLVGNHLAANYGPNYHAASDTYDKVDLISLKKNSAIIAALILGYANAPESMIPRDRHSREQIEALIESQHLEFAMRMFNVWDVWTNGSRGRQ